MNEIETFTVDIPQSELDGLNRRLDDVRWPDELPGAGWDYGVDRGHLEGLVEHWRHGFDWRAVESALNAMPQFVTEIDRQRVHFAHVRSPRPDAVPLLITHGWPSTIADFQGVVGPLTDPGDDAPAFHLVLPSLPGFGFSGPTTERGWDVGRIARAWAELMSRLGYDRYLTQGGDWGAFVAPEVGRADPDHVVGVHVNAMVTQPDWTSPDPFAGLTDDERAQVQAQAGWWQPRSGYAVLQSTRPQTLAYALTDSPVGQLAWNLEWFVDYDPTTSERPAVDPDAILTNVATYWFTRTAGSSGRIYRESQAAFRPGPVSGVPTAVAKFPGDGVVRALAERSHRIVRWSEPDRGGHFAALQAPDLLVADVQAFAAELASRRA